ncbi:M56 family metallopeptidase [Sphingomonas jatrophae]|uniref:Signal transducer regulating beta-lactamase production, contains metallopeptidase domain n=1 Tax=Sphingomonas jatrophae TaxID=1166337 RepID=A0A1I6KZM7_9SPHN|nr:M56 family metallopeptidase [Sphingomonas jatrophae]SFR96380.1 Signal transducer regulating beta-lactamase production, contains metallopeptidase domain [Sphingomonas jatrophae]
MIGWLVSTLAASTALMLLVLAIRRPVARRFGPRAAYALWLLPALRMVLPPLPASVTPVAPQLPANLDLAALLAAVPASPSPTAAPATSWLASLDWLAIAAGVWLGIAAIRFALPFVAYRRFMRGALAGGRLLARERGVAVHLSSRLAGPLAAGVIARRIVLPRDFHNRFTAQEQQLALAHETAHHARGDTVANMVGLAVLALHWWNPVAHMAWRAFRADQELACDAIVLNGADADARHAYGSALVKAAFGGTPVAACGLGRVAELKTRLRALAQEKQASRAGTWLAAALVVGGLAGTASGGAAAEKVRAFGEQVRHALPEVPAPPTPPAAPAIPATHAAPMPPVPPQVTVDGMPYVPAPHAGQLAPLAPLAPAAPLDMLAPPIPPVPPLPPIAIDGRALNEALAASQVTRSEALREAALARGEALREAAEARREAMQEAKAARREALQAAVEARAEAQQQLREAMRQARAQADECRDSGAAAREECDREVQAEVRRAMAEAQRDIARAHAEMERDMARAMAEMGRR